MQLFYIYGGVTVFTEELHSNTGVSFILIRNEKRCVPAWIQRSSFVDTLHTDLGSFTLGGNTPPLVSWNFIKPFWNKRISLLASSVDPYSKDPSM